MLHTKNVLASQVKSINLHKYKSVVSTESTFDFLGWMISEKWTGKKDEEVNIG